MLFEVNVNTLPADVTVEEVARVNEEACRKHGLISPECTVVSKFVEKLKLSYPIPSVERDDIMGQVLPHLEKNYQIFSRGRFGDWKYEYSN